MQKTLEMGGQDPQLREQGVMLCESVLAMAFVPKTVLLSLRTLQQTLQLAAFPLREWDVSLPCCVLILNLGESLTSHVLLNMAGFWHWTC